MNRSPTSPGTPSGPTETPQRRLAAELRFWIDHSMKRPTEANLAKLADMIRDNPNGWASEHVRHNLGARRLGWVEEALKEVAP